MTATAVVNGAAANGKASANGAGGSSIVSALYEKVRSRDPDQKEFLQAVKEVLDSLEPVLEKHPEFAPALERLCEPERQIMFRVPWLDDAGNIRVNRGFRVQFSSALGPYKGGLRFHPTVTLSVIKFLGFEQILKNALTTLPMGGGKGGSDFDPKGKSDNEVMKFCQSFMTELFRHVGAQTDVPAGDIGVGGREVGFLYGQYKRLANEFVGVLTGKGNSFGGSLMRPEATGYGSVYYGEEILKSQGQSFEGKRVLVSGSGNVSLYAAKKLLEIGAIVLTLSDSHGYVYEPEGFSQEALDQVVHIKDNRGRLEQYKSPSGKGVYVAGERAWAADTKADVAMPCATQNEIEEADAIKLADMGVKIVLEGANMPSTPEAIDVMDQRGIVLGCAKACNAGGVAVSGLEMAQNATMASWPSEDVDKRLKGIMQNIYQATSAAAKEYNTTLQAGANIAGFLKVAEAMTAQGAV